MNLTKKDYENLVNKKTPNSNLLKNMIWAFAVGGGICVIGQLISNTLKNIGYSKDESAIATSIILVFLGAFFTGLGIYDKLAKYAGAGTIVPITGFANSIVSPAIEFKSEGLILGVGAKMFIIAGPVLVYGICASIIYGLILYIFKLM